MNDIQTALAKFFGEMFSDVKDIKSELSELKSQINNVPARKLFKDYCAEQGITRQTGYKWRDKGIITTEMIGGKMFVVGDVARRNKYQREQQPA